MKMDGGEFNLTPCCDQHDICYDTCGSSRKVCDADFTKCLNSVCNSQTTGKKIDDCNGTSQLFSMGASGFGCGSFAASQHQACMCGGVLAKDAVKAHSLKNKHKKIAGKEKKKTKGEAKKKEL